MLETNPKAVAAIVKWSHAVIVGEMSLEALSDALDLSEWSFTPEDYATAIQEVVESPVTNDDHIAHAMDLFLVFERRLHAVRKPPKLSTDHPLVLYHQENQAMRQALAEGLRLREAPFDAAAWQAYAASLASYRLHYVRKQNQLYPRLEARNFTYPTRIAWHYDDEAASLLAALVKTSEEGTHKAVHSAFMAVREAILDGMLEEERVIFPVAFRLIPLTTFLRMEVGDSEIGYAFIEGPSYSREEQVMMRGLEGLMRQHDGRMPEDFFIPLERGKLSLTQLNLMLRHLPFDLSFVDAEDVVRYYNERKDRIFLRSPGAIGRDVKNCHPRESLGLVTSIIDAFRAGERDRAAFWYEYKERLIYVEYIAVRDARGGFAGIIELAQDITDFQGLEGERRLPDWK